MPYETNCYLQLTFKYTEKLLVHTEVCKETQTFHHYITSHVIDIF